MYSLKVFRDTAAGLVDLLNYAGLVDEGIVQCKDGSLLGGWFFRGPDAEGQTASERNYTASRVNAALAKMGTGWISWTDASRRHSTNYPAPERSFFPDPVTRAMDDMRRQAFEAEGGHFETEYVFVVQYLPPTKVENRFLELFYDDDRKKSVNEAARLLEKFKQALQELEDSLSSVLKMRRMTSHRFEGDLGRVHYQDDMLSYLQGLLRGEPATVTVPPFGMYLDAVLGGMEFTPAVYPLLGENFIACVVVEGYPEESFPGLLDILSELPMRSRWSTRMIYLDGYQAVGEIEKYRRKWKQKERPILTQIMRSDGGGRINEDAVQMVGEADSAIAEASSGVVRYGYKTTTVILMDPSRSAVEENARGVKKVFEALGFIARIETTNAVEAWLGSLPGHYEPNVRRPPLHTLQLADMLPLSTVWPGHALCPNPLYPPDVPALMYTHTEGGTPFRLNVHYGDLGHVKIFGPTGAGKSTLLCELAGQFRRYKGANILAFDVDYSLFALCSAAGGKHYEMGTGATSPGFAPLSQLDGATDLLWAAEWLETAYTLQTNLPLTPTQRVEVQRALRRLRDGDSPRGITEFLMEIQDEDIREVLHFYSAESACGQLFDSKEDTMAVSNFTVLEMDELMGMTDKVVLPLLLYLFRRFEKSLTGQPAVLFLDEAWRFLGHPAFKEKIREWLKTLRKANCAVIMATQSLSDAAKSGIIDVLMESCPTSIYLPNPEAEKRGTTQNPGPRDFYEMLGLNDSEIELIKNGVKKRDYYFSSPEGRRVFQLGLSPLELAFVGVSGKEDVKRVQELNALHGPKWPQEWLREKGVDYDLGL